MQWSKTCQIMILSIDHLNLVLTIKVNKTKRKGVYPYEYMDSSNLHGEI